MSIWEVCFYYAKSIDALGMVARDDALGMVATLAPVCVEGVANVVPWQLHPLGRGVPPLALPLPPLAPPA